MTKFPYKILKSIILLGLSSCSNPFPNNKNNDEPNYASPFASNIQTMATYGPFNSLDDDIDISCTYYSYSDSTYEKITYIDIASGIAFSSKSITEHEFDFVNKKVTFSFPFQISSTLTNGGIYIKIEVVDKDTNRTLISSISELHPKSPLIIDSSIASTTDISNLLFSIPSNSYIVSERYSFVETVNTFQNNDYYTLPLDGINFSYTNKKNFTYKKSYLTIDDKYGFFNAFKEDGIVKIPLICSESNDKTTISFDYKNKMYVDEQTLLMSPTSLYGYKQADYFYLPRNKGKEMDEAIFKIIIEEAGINESTVIIPITYYSLRNHFGNCDDSDYCVKGEIVR